MDRQQAMQLPPSSTFSSTEGQTCVLAKGVLRVNKRFISLVKAGESSYKRRLFVKKSFVVSGKVTA